MLIEVGKRPGETRGRFFICPLAAREAAGTERMEQGAEDDAPGALDAVMATLFDKVALRLAMAIEQLETGRPSEVRAAQRSICELRLALWMLVDERTRLDRLRNKVAGIVGDAGGGGERKLDLDAARDEIGRRLAGLRAAGGGG